MSGQSASSPLSSETGSLTIDLVFDSSVANAPAGFKPTADAVAAYLESQFATPITITIDVGYGEVDGTRLGSGDLGESESTGIDVSYQEVRSALLARTATADEIAAAASLPVNDPASGLDPYGYYVTYAEAEALGLSDGPGTGRAQQPVQIHLRYHERCRVRHLRRVRYHGARDHRGHGADRGSW
jgi:hypothetical protein